MKLLAILAVLAQRLVVADFVAELDFKGILSGEF